MNKSFDQQLCILDARTSILVAPNYVLATTTGHVLASEKTKFFTYKILRYQNEARDNFFLQNRFNIANVIVQ